MNLHKKVPIMMKFKLLPQRSPLFFQLAINLQAKWLVQQANEMHMHIPWGIDVAKSLLIMN